MGDCSLTRRRHIISIRSRTVQGLVLIDVSCLQDGQTTVCDPKVKTSYFVYPLVVRFPFSFPPPPPPTHPHFFFLPPPLPRPHVVLHICIQILILKSQLIGLFSFLVFFPFCSFCRGILQFAARLCRLFVLNKWRVTSASKHRQARSDGRTSFELVWPSGAALVRWWADRQRVVSLRDTTLLTIDKPAWALTSLALSWRRSGAMDINFVITGILVSLAGVVPKCLLGQESHALSSLSCRGCTEMFVGSRVPCVVQSAQFSLYIVIFKNCIWTKNLVSVLLSAIPIFISSDPLTEILWSRNTAAGICLTICTGAGKRLHTLSSHPNVGWTSGFYLRNAIKQTVHSDDDGVAFGIHNILSLMSI